MTITVSLSPEILSLLRGKGLTAQRAGEILGVGPRQAGYLLRKAGATMNHNNCKWTIR